MHFLGTSIRFAGSRPKCYLTQFIDDATGETAHATFCEQENTNNFFAHLQGYLRKHGKPEEFYVDPKFQGEESCRVVRAGVLQ